MKKAEIERLIREKMPGWAYSATVGGSALSEKPKYRAYTPTDEDDSLICVLVHPAGDPGAEQKRVLITDDGRVIPGQG